MVSTLAGLKPSSPLARPVHHSGYALLFVRLVSVYLIPTAVSEEIFVDDVATADVSAGTGGLDASIGFETNRAENGGGPAMNNTVGFFASYVNAYLSSMFSRISCNSESN